MTTKNTGFYFNTRTWELDLHREDGSGDYLRVPALALLILGPVLGFLFVIFLPFIGFALAARQLGHRASGWFGRKADAPGSASSGPTKS